jgi:[histone H3]-trimethyl-L-lysine4 demethylase
MTRWPYVDKKPLDLYRLKKAVEARGGFEKVCKLKKWAEIGRDLGYSGKIMSSLSTSLKNSYQKWLCPYEDYLRIAKPGVHQQLELEYGGPLTPSPAPSPMKRSNVPTPASASTESPARHLTDALQASIDAQTKGSDQDASMADTPASNTPKPASGFTAVNSGGFTAVNSGFTSVNRSIPAVSDGKGPMTPKPNGTPTISTKNTPEFRSSLLGPSGLKRQMSCDSQDSVKKDSADQEDGDSGSRRSKRLKKGELLQRSCGPLVGCAFDTNSELQIRCPLSLGRICLSSAQPRPGYPGMKLHPQDRYAKFYISRSQL